MQKMFVSSKITKSHFCKMGLISCSRAPISRHFDKCLLFIDQFFVIFDAFEFTGQPMQDPNMMGMQNQNMMAMNPGMQHNMPALSPQILSVINNTIQSYSQTPYAQNVANLLTSVVQSYMGVQERVF